MFTILALGQMWRIYPKTEIPLMKLFDKIGICFCLSIISIEIDNIAEPDKPIKDKKR
jgi:hypothetical protein